jgi:hypothetical protein
MYFNERDGSRISRDINRSRGAPYGKREEADGEKHTAFLETRLASHKTRGADRHGLPNATPAEEAGEDD